MANELILVVEDNERNRKLVRDVLTFKGYQIIEAATGEEVLRLAQERRPSLILMDIRLPGTDGVDALGRLGRRLLRLPGQADQGEGVPRCRRTAPRQSSKMRDEQSVGFVYRDMSMTYWLEKAQAEMRESG